MRVLIALIAVGNLMASSIQEIVLKNEIALEDEANVFEDPEELEGQEIVIDDSEEDLYSEMEDED